MKAKVTLGLLIIGSTTLISCEELLNSEAKTVDTIAPTISLNTTDSTILEAGSAFIDPGATVNDDIDVSKQVIGTGEIDTRTIGFYTITYHASDVAGNKAQSVDRIFQVVDTTDPIVEWRES